MTIETTGDAPTHLLRGRISNLRKTRCSHDFVFSQSDRTRMQATAVSAGLAGLGGVAVSLNGMAADTTDEADLLEFELNGQAVKAWVWLSVFDEGDEVEVVAEQLEEYWHGYGVRRVNDKIVALHPHCSRGRNAHNKYSMKLWLKATVPIILFSYLLTGGFAYFESMQNWAGILRVWITGGLGVLVIFGVIAYRVSRKFMGFVRLAESIFQQFGWSDVKDIDLPAITKKNKKNGESEALGILFFRY